MVNKNKGPLYYFSMFSSFLILIFKKIFYWEKIYKQVKSPFLV